MEIKSYQNKTKPLTIKLVGGDEVEIKYFPNYLTGEALRALYEKRQRADGEGEANVPVVIDNYDTVRDHLCMMLGDIDLTDNGKKIAFKSTEEKQRALSIFSYDDLQGMVEQINGDLAAPLEKTGTDSSAGPAPKDE